MHDENIHLYFISHDDVQNNYLKIQFLCEALREEFNITLHAYTFPQNTNS